MSKVVEEAQLLVAALATAIDRRDEALARNGELEAQSLKDLTGLRELAHLVYGPMTIEAFEAMTGASLARDLKSFLLGAECETLLEMANKFWEMRKARLPAPTIPVGGVYQLRSRNDPGQEYREISKAEYTIVKEHPGVWTVRKLQVIS